MHMKQCGKKALRNDTLSMMLGDQRNVGALPHRSHAPSVVRDMLALNIYIADHSSIAVYSVSTVVRLRKQSIIDRRAAWWLNVVALVLPSMSAYVSRPATHVTGGLPRNRCWLWAMLVMRLRNAVLPLMSKL